MKGKHFLYALIVSEVILLTGVFFRINHINGSDTLLISGLVVQLIIIVLAFIKYRTKIGGFMKK